MQPTHYYQSGLKPCHIHNYKIYKCIQNVSMNTAAPVHRVFVFWVKCFFNGILGLNFRKSNFSCVSLAADLQL